VIVFRYRLVFISALFLVFFLPAPLTAQIHWYAPHYLSSVDEAQNKFQFMSAHFAPQGNGYTVSRIDVNKLGINLTFSGNGLNDVVTSVVYADTGYFDVVDFTKVDISANAAALFPNPFLPKEHYNAPWCVVARVVKGQNGIICVPTLQDAHDLMDVLSTLMVANGQDPKMSMGAGTAATPDKELQKHPEQSGLRVREVDLDSPEAAAGIKPGDILHTANGKLCAIQGDYAGALVAAAQTAPNGGAVHVEVLRRGKLMPLDVHYPYMWMDQAAMQKLRQSGEELAQQNGSPAPALATPAAGFRLGIQSRAVTDADVIPFALVTARGILVVNVEKDSLAERMGLEADDVILEVNNSEIGDAQLFVQFVRSGTVKTLHVWRKGQTLDVVVPESL
jgi:hypothetical protein